MNAELTPQLLERLSSRFAALGDSTRLRLLHALQRGERRVGDLAKELDMGQPSISKHLMHLRHVGLVLARRQGTEAYYAIRDDSIFALCDLVCTSVRRQVAEDAALLAAPPRRRTR